MHIALEARSLSSSMGVRIYTLELIRRLLARHPADYSIILDAAKHHGTFPGAREMIVPLRHDAMLFPWLWYNIPRLLRKLQPNVVHYTKAAVPLKKQYPTVVTIHDVIPLILPQSQKLSRRWYWPATLRHAAQRSDAIIAISECTRADIIKYFNVDSAKITVTPLGCDRTHFHPITDVTRRAEVLQRYTIPTPYLLFVGTLEPRKNIPALIRAFTAIAPQIPHMLVIAGKKGWMYEEIFTTYATSAVQNRIMFIDQVPYADLPVLLSTADAFVWPSAYEGWGLPVLEALACGAPVVVSDGGALPEVVGDAGEIVPFVQSAPARRLNDPDFEQQFSARILALLQDESRQARLRAAGPARAELFSWDTVADTTFQVYERLAV